MLVWTILILILIVVAVNEIYNFRTGVPTIASFPASRRKIIEVLQQNFATRTEAEPIMIIDLGSGNGQLAAQIARALPKAQVLGIEISYLPWLTSAVRQKLFGPRNVTFRRLDFWGYDCKSIDAVVLYANGAIIDRVSQKLRSELKPGAVVVTNEIPLRADWQPTETLDTHFLKMKVYVYRQK